MTYSLKHYLDIIIFQRIHLYYGSGPILGDLMNYL